MTADRLLAIVALFWFLCVVLYLFTGGIIHVEAAPIWGNDDVTCGVWTYYASGLAETVRRNREIPACRDCVGLAVTVDRSQLGRQIDIRHAGQWVGPFLVVDVGTGRHRPGLVGEVDYQTAMTWHITRPWLTCYRGSL